MAADAVRAFFALELGASARAAAERVMAALRERSADARGVRFVRTESLHVTLRFLGDVPVARLGELVAAVARELSAVPPFVFALGSLSGFPTARRPRVLALGVEPAEPLARAAAAVERGTVAAGLPAESRPFRAHLTLARVKGRAPAIDGIATPENPPGEAREVVLLQSELRPDGARYTPLERMPLGGSVSSEPRL